MDMKKFNERMGKRQKMAKGGSVKKIAGKKYFAAGGVGGPSSVGTPAATVNNNGLTGTIANALGLNNQFQAQSANLQAGTNAEQLNQAYQGAQGALDQQQNLANQAQPGVAQGFGTQANLTGQLQGVINGTGPNAAQTALNQNTATNVANQAALMAGQRGSSANAGLLARQAAQQGAATQQQAVGQGATLQAQQQIAAQQQLADLASQQVGQGASAVQGLNNAQQNEQNILQGSNTAFNNANVAMQSNLNNVNAGVAAGNQQAAGKMVNGITGAAASLVGLAQGGEVDSHHCAGASCTDRQHSMHMMASGGGLQVNHIPSKMAAGPWLQSSVDTRGPAIEAAGSAAPQSVNPFGDVEDKLKDFKNNPKDAQPPVASGGDTTPGAFANAGNNFATAGNNFGVGPAVGSVQDFGAIAPSMPVMGSPLSVPPPKLAKGGNIADGPHGSHVANFLFSKGGSVPAMVSPGERYLSPDEVKQVVEHGDNPLKLGKKIPGKAKVKGDSLKNDTVPATLQDGGVVLPRHIMNKKNRDHAELFVRRAVHMKAPKGGK